jgi:hypothetical protein
VTTADTADRIRELLETGAAAARTRYQRAAIHLLGFTEILGQAPLAAYIEYGTVDLDGRETPAAWICNWPALGRLDNLGYLSGGAERLVRLAAGIAHGMPLDLRAALSSLGHEHARRVLEAVAICHGADEFYTITPTPALAENQRFKQQLLADALRRRGLDENGEPL